MTLRFFLKLPIYEIIYEIIYVSIVLNSKGYHIETKIVKSHMDIFCYSIDQTNGSNADAICFPNFYFGRPNFNFDRPKKKIWSGKKKFGRPKKILIIQKHQFHMKKR